MPPRRGWARPYALCGARRPRHKPQRPQPHQAYTYSSACGVAAAGRGGARDQQIQQQRDGGRKTSGAVVVGSKGLLFSPDDYGAKYFLLPEDDFAGYKPPPQKENSNLLFCFKKNTVIRMLKFTLIELIYPSLNYDIYLH